MDKATISEVKEKVLIEDYFNKVIVPDLKDYYADYSNSLEYKDFTLCPLHVEDTPSLKVYRDTNTFYCFGCKRGGDVIKLHILHQSMNNGIEVSFKDAVNYLKTVFVDRSEDYITSRNHVRYEVESKLPDKVEYSNADVVFMLGEVQKLYRLMPEKKLKKELLEVWRNADCVIGLIANSEIEVDDAIKEVAKMKSIIYRAFKST